MRTTVRLDQDVLAGIATLRRERALNLSDAVNVLARAGLAANGDAGKAGGDEFHQRTAAMGMRIDITDVADTLDLLDEADRA
ncbi:MAG: hypothetical protein LBK72_07525 [Bifidobacteriaceae bacterium]|nr:hypothetical protein [Bifidobacteriaceae bacterium]